MIETTLIAVFLTGLLGGVHCAGMCGGIVSALGMLRGRRTADPEHAESNKRPQIIRIHPVSAVGRVNLDSDKQAANEATPHTSMHGTSTAIGGALEGGHSTVWRPPSHLLAGINDVLLYNVGRIFTYTILGLLVGSIGSAGWLLQSALPVQQSAFALTNILLILMGLYVCGVRRIGQSIESLGQYFWHYVRPLATRRLAGSGSVNALLTGSLWGLVPCGMVYGVLMAALLSGSSGNGAALMFAFGLGTLPNLVLLGLSGQWLARATRHRGLRLLMGVTIIGFGVLGLLRLDVASRIPIVRDLCVHLPSLQ